MKVLIVTAGDEAFAPLLRGTIESVKRFGPPPRFELACFDLGLSAETLKWVRARVSRVVQPQWDLPVEREVMETHGHFRAMTVRPFLPRYFPGYDLFIWLDADSWVQQWSAIEWLAQGASAGKLAAAPQVDRAYRHHPMAVAWRIGRLRLYFGSNIPLEILMTETYVNSGVFALEATAPHWEAWAHWFREGLNACGGRTVCDQTALNFALWKEDLPLSPLPARANWACHLARPEYRFSDGLFVEPAIPGDPIGIMHLTHKSKDDAVEMRGPDGTMRTISLRFDPARKAR